ncbi:MAG: shikimate dehydrogenase [Calditrichaeota bacterium]|nr:shikimate dehydrogenase [Calditrichota bacterium]
MNTTIKRYGIIGFPLKHSFSPYIHNRAFGDLGIKAVYEKIETEPEKFEEKMAELKSGNLSGLNVTIPYKERILRFIDQIDPYAKAIGAVNTIKCHYDRWTGYNTDWAGFLKPIETDLDSIEKCLITGAGGAARAVAFALLKVKRVEFLWIANRTVQRAEKLVRTLKQHGTIEFRTSDLNEAAECGISFDLIVNTTSVGMSGQKEELIIDPQPISKPGTIIYDLIYNPLETPLLQAAAKLNLKTVNGLPMLIFQAEEAFKIWTGRRFNQNTINHLFDKLPELIR